MSKIKTAKPKIEPRLGDKIPEQWLKEAEGYLKAGHKLVVVPSFRDEKDVEMHIHVPDSGNESSATDEYTKAFNRLIKDEDLMTREQMAAILNKKGIWGEVQEKKIEDIQEEMRAIELVVARMRKKGNFNKATMNRYRIKWKAYRDDVNLLLNTKHGLLSNSIEGRAEEHEIRAKLSLCVKYPNGERVWPSYDEFSQEREKIVVLQLLNEAMFFWAGLSQEIISELPVQIVFGGEEELENSQEA